MKYFLFVLLLCPIFTFGQSIKGEKIKSSYLDYPSISAAGIKYEGLQLDIVTGDITIQGKNVVESAALCKPKGGSITDSKALKQYYYNINYSSPDTYIQLSDATGKIVLVKRIEPYNALGKFGDDKCYFVELILTSAYDKEKENFAAELNEFARQEAVNNGEEWVNASISFRYTPEEFEINYIKDDAYTDLQQAKDLAVEGFALVENDQSNTEGQNKLLKAVDIWKKAMEESNPDDKKARIDKKVSIAILENLAIAGMYLQDFDMALSSISDAINMRTGVTSNATITRDNLKELIYERKQNYDLNKDVPVMVILNRIKADVHPASELVQFRANYSNFKAEEMADQYKEAKKEHDAAVASGAINPYREKMVKTATQGYMLTLPQLGGFDISSLEEMKSAMQKLDVFPVEICELTELNQLILKNNNIQSIPLEIKNLQDLKVLNLANNKLTTLPEVLGELKNLKKLTIKGNNIPQGDIDKIQSMLPDLKIK